MEALLIAPGAATLAPPAAPATTAVPAADASTLVLSKEVYDSEMQWGRLVIPGKFLGHFKRMQQEFDFKGDYHLWVQDDAQGKRYQIGVKLAIQRPMVTELHTLYRGNKMVPGDTVQLCRHTATGQLHVSVLRGTQRAASGVDHAAAAGPSTSYASAGGASSRRSSASRTPSFDVEAFDSTPTSHRRARRSQQGGGGGRRRERHSEDAGGEGGECWAWEEEEERGSGEEEGGQVEMYVTGSGRIATRLVRTSSGGYAREAAVHDGFSSRWASEDSEAMEVDEPMDTTLFDALVNVAADCLSA